MNDLETKEQELLKQIEEWVRQTSKTSKFMSCAITEIGKSGNLSFKDYRKISKLNNILHDVKETEKKLEAIQKQPDAQPKIEPVFSDDMGDLLYDGANYKYRRLVTWQKARARIIEKINIANKGDNGFKAGKPNHKICLEYDHENKNSKLSSCGNTRAQDAEPMVYIRTWEAAQELLSDPEFCDDMRTYFEGWL